MLFFVRQERSTSSNLFPAKYTSHIFEDVGNSIDVKILFCTETVVRFGNSVKIWKGA